MIENIATYRGEITLNEFEVYEQLIALESIANQYPKGRDFSAEIKKVTSQITSRLYRVAVIGEFKRGKSSLINALIGAEVLPTDILPMTAAVTRVTYGNERKILIRFKDGHSEERTVEELLDYATKYDEEKARMAANIREIEVCYPSVFCQNHIDILDTPGLNDNESMTDVTLSVLGEVDAAIVVISAAHPVSMTEKQLILDLIAQRQIRHLVFVITHIDMLRRKREQDQIIQFITDRITGEVLQMSQERFEQDPYFQQKAIDVLTKPDVFGVSSIQAIEGFVQDNWELLEESRFPHLKNELLALLTAAQSADIVEKAKDMAWVVNQQLDDWHASGMCGLQEKRNVLQSRRREVQHYCENAAGYVNRLLLQLDRQIAEAHLSAESLSERLETELRKIFIRELCTIRRDNCTDEAVREALNRGITFGDEYTQRLQRDSLGELKKIMISTADRYMAERCQLGLSDKELVEELGRWGDTSLPAFNWVISPIPGYSNLKDSNVMINVNRSIQASAQAFARDLEEYISQLRLILIRRKVEDGTGDTMINRVDEQLRELEQEMVYMERNTQLNRRKMDSIRQKLGVW